MSENPKGVTHLTILNYVVCALIGFQTLTLKWAFSSIEKMQKAGEEERKQLLDHALQAAQNSAAAKEVAETTKAAVDSTKKVVAEVKKTVENIQ